MPRNKKGSRRKKELDQIQAFRNSELNADLDVDNYEAVYTSIMRTIFIGTEIDLVIRGLEFIHPKNKGEYRTSVARRNVYLHEFAALQKRVYRLCLKVEPNLSNAYALSIIARSGFALVPSIEIKEEVESYLNICLSDKTWLYEIYKICNFSIYSMFTILYEATELESVSLIDENIDNDYKFERKCFKYVLLASKSIDRACLFIMILNVAHKMDLFALTEPGQMRDFCKRIDEIYELYDDQLEDPIAPLVWTLFPPPKNKWMINQ